MKQFSSLRQRLHGSLGATVLFVALALIVLLSFVALAVDVGYMVVVKNELQNVADSGALAGARQLGAMYEALTVAAQQSYQCEKSTITPPIVEVGPLNKAGNVPITIRTEDIEVGFWDANAKQFTDCPSYPCAQPDAVRVVSRRDSAANSPVNTFFAYLMGSSTFESSTEAIAALTGVSEVGPGEVIPVGLSKDWFDSTPQFCGQPIKFNPSRADEGCAGWHTFERWPASTAYLRDTILEGWLSGDYSPPGAELPVDFVFYGATPGETQLIAFENLFNYMKTRDDDDDPFAWSVYVPVYDMGTGCSNPQGRLPIVGFAATKITSISGPPLHLINAIVTCDQVEPNSRGGGGNYGVKGAIPGLVR